MVIADAHRIDVLGADVDGKQGEDTAAAADVEHTLACEPVPTGLKRVATVTTSFRLELNSVSLDSRTY